MALRNRTRCWLVGGLVLAVGPAALAQQPEAVNPRVEPEAAAVLRRMSDHLAGHAQFEFRSEITADIVEETGEKLEFGSILTVAVRRPNRLAATTERDDGTVRRIWYDGARLAILEADEQAYAVAPAPATIDQMLDYAVAELDLSVPLTDLLYSDVYPGFMAEVESGYYVGLHRVDGVPAHHLAFSHPFVDWQIWIEEGERPIPRKFVVTYKKRFGHPQYRARLLSWEASPEFDDALFRFVPPAGASEVPLLPNLGSARPGREAD